MDKKVCLLAGDDKDNIIQDYVVFLVQELSKISDVYYFADANMSEKELSKIRAYTKYAQSAPHKGKYFGSWQYLMHYIGWRNLENYDEMIICNDSIYGPMTNMEDIFYYMELKNYDFWGLTENYHSNYHLDSYFMVFNQDVIKNCKFQEFWKSITPEIGGKSYETILTPFLTELGFIGNSYIKNYKKEDQLAYPLHLLKHNKMPFIRIKSLKSPETNLKEPLLYIDGRIKNKTGYDVNLIKSHLSADKNFKGFGLNYYVKNTIENIKNKVENLFS